jgi:hypothetical protein
MVSRPAKTRSPSAGERNATMGGLVSATTWMLIVASATWPEESSTTARSGYARGLPEIGTVKR